MKWALSKIDARLGLTILAEMREAEKKAWDSLRRYKFVMFGYWCGVWVHLNRIGPQGPNPFVALVKQAKAVFAEKYEGVTKCQKCGKKTITLWTARGPTCIPCRKAIEEES